MNRLLGAGVWGKYAHGICLGILIVLWCPLAAAAFVKVAVKATDNCTSDPDPHAGRAHLKSRENRRLGA
jgi:hypothetical protein